MMENDFSSLLRIEVIDHGEQERGRTETRCSVCLLSNSMKAYLLTCGHRVCDSCNALVNSGDTTVFCVSCQIRNVSPNPNQEVTSTESSFPPISSSSLSSEKNEILKTQLAKLHHLDEAVYKPLGKHFDRVLQMIKNGLDKNVKLVEAHFEEIVDVMEKRKKKIIRSLKQNTKANKIMIENRKKAMEKERVQLKEYTGRLQNRVRNLSNGKRSEIVLNSFLSEVDGFQRKARKMSTENSVTELDDLEVVNNSDVEVTIKDAVEQMTTLREKTQHLKSRVGTPTSSLSWSLEESSSRKGRPTSHLVPTPPRRTKSLSPKPCSPRVPVTPRDQRSEADGCEPQVLQNNRYLPDITSLPPPGTEPPARRTESGQPSALPAQDASIRELYDGPHRSCRGSKSCERSLQKTQERSAKRTLPNIPLIQEGRALANSRRPRVKYQTLLQDNDEVERPSGICRLQSGMDGAVAVADCGRGRILDVSLDGRVTGSSSVWEDDGESVKAQGVFDVTQMDGGCLVVSDSQRKEVILFDEGRRVHSLQLPEQIDPRGVTSHGHRVFICDQGNHCVQMLDLRDKHDCKPKSTAIALSKPSEEGMVCPYYASIDQTGNRLLVSDYGAGALILARTDNAQPPLRVKLVASHLTSRHGPPSTATNIEIRPTGVAWLPDGRGAVVADQIGHRLVVVDEELRVVGSFGQQGAGDGEFLFPHGITFVRDDILSVCDMNNARIQFISLESILASINE
ncbi:uncharacterized protein LOC129282914 [Lytechinus pictus]|uniref:uncharacterized protein LOC129282914 n=1 Tax=Lytechinus pictus TaxID=7653 RepID=UPI0030B9C8AA